MVDEVPNAKKPKTALGRFGRWLGLWVYVILNTLFAERQ